MFTAFPMTKHLGNPSVSLRTSIIRWGNSQFSFSLPIQWKLWKMNVRHMVDKQRKGNKIYPCGKSILPGFQYTAVLSNEIGHNSQSPFVFHHCETAERSCRLRESVDICTVDVYNKSLVEVSLIRLLMDLSVFSTTCWSIVIYVQYGGVILSVGEIAIRFSPCIQHHKKWLSLWFTRCATVI